MNSSNASISALPQVAVVTLTYGRRWHLLSAVIAELLQHDTAISDIVVVSNAAQDNLAERLPQSAMPRVHFVPLAENLGSAEGYARGIRYASELTDIDLIWLLDDDNRPQAGALNKLLAAYAILGNNPDCAVAALRQGNRESTLAAHGLMQIGIRPNSFLKFHAADLYAKVARRWRERKIQNVDAYKSPLTRIGYAPYGGLLFHRHWVQRIGLPDARYFLYADDYEYSSRFGINGGAIYLCASAVVEDLEASWYKHRVRVHPLFEEDAKLGRLYYSTRNSAHLEASRFVKSWLVYYFNVALYLSALSLQSLLVQRKPRHTLARLRLILSALRAGWRGELGATLPAALQIKIRSGGL